MPCKCGHNLVDHPCSQVASYGQKMSRFPCKLCDCKDYDPVPVKVRGF